MPIVILALLVALAGAGGAVHAAQDAHPGDGLYGLKMAVEQSGLAAPVAAPSDAGKPEGKGRGQDKGEQAAISTLVSISGTVGITLSDTMTDVVALANDPKVPGQSENGLEAKLRAAAKSLVKGNNEAARAQLDAFVSQLNAMRGADHISEATYNSLHGQYSTLITAVGGTALPTVTPSSEPDDDDDEPGRGKPPKNANKGKSKSDSAAPLQPRGR